MNYWLLKSEPDAFSWDDMKSDNTTDWSGVRNYQARNNLMAMRNGDLCFFYHSNIGKEIVGIVRVCAEYMPDPSDESGKFGMVKVEYIEPFKSTVTLADIKANPALENMQFLKQSRLSVSNVNEAEWQAILKLST